MGTRRWGATYQLRTSGERDRRAGTSPIPFIVSGAVRRYDSFVTRRLFVFDAPDRFAAATVGDPGHRSFFLQARQGRAVVTLGLEKTQVAALAQRIGELLLAADRLPSSSDRQAGGGEETVEPTPELFRVGLLAIAWDGQTSQLTVEARPIDRAGEYAETPDDDPDGPDLLRVQLSPEQGLEYVRHVAALVAAGRPSCPFCGEPLDPSGHFCTRANGQLN